MKKIWIYGILFLLSLCGGVFFAFQYKIPIVFQNASFLPIIHVQKQNEQEKEIKKEPEEKISDVTKLIFVGDIMLSRGVEGRITRFSNNSFPFLLSSTTLASYDITIGNLEGPISERGVNQGSMYSFRAKPTVIEGLMASEFDVLSLANNHMFDWGYLALSDTVSFLRDAGIQTVGAGRTVDEANGPVLISKNGQTFAFLSYTDLYPKSLNATGTIPGMSEYNPEKIVLRIRELKEKGYVVFVMLHWGEEYQMHSNESQKTIGRKFIDAGADAIVGGHPHVAQEIERYKNGWIVYSLGNFIFDQNFSKETMEGLTVEILVKEGKIIDVISHTIKMNKDFQPEFTAL